jgi:anion-transporting  ArsA/GET3 family ATPase
MQLLAADETAFVLVTSPRRDAVEEAAYFAQRLADGDYAVDALVVNRVHPQYTDADPDALRARGAELAAHGGDAAARLAARYANLADFEDVALRERAELAGLEQRIGDASVAHVPELGHDVHDFTALRAVGSHLLAAD